MILTTNNLTSNIDNIFVTLNDSTRIKSKFLYSHKDYLAIIKVDSKYTKNLTAIELPTNTYDLTLGENIYLVGSILKTNIINSFDSSDFILSNLNFTKDDIGTPIINNKKVVGITIIDDYKNKKNFKIFNTKNLSNIIDSLKLNFKENDIKTKVNDSRYTLLNKKIKSIKSTSKYVPKNNDFGIKSIRTNQKIQFIIPDFLNQNLQWYKKNLFIDNIKNNNYDISDSKYFIKLNIKRKKLFIKF